MRNVRFLPVLLAASALALPGHAALARVGVASVVEGEPIGLPPGGTQRILRVGIDMAADEKVTTKSDDRAHLVFLDGTSLTIGPDSEVVIDKFVYDPEKKTGEMVLKVQRGTMRFVGGVISKSSEVKVTTPSASMGIRGGIFTVAVTQSGATTANFLFGQSFTCTSQGVTETTTTPGSRIVVTPGSPPTPPMPIPPGGLQNNMASFQGKDGGGPTGPGRSPPGGPQGNNNRGDSGGRAGGSGGQGSGNQGGSDNKGKGIGDALKNSNLTNVNSGLTPKDALSKTPSHDQIVTIVTDAGGSGGKGTQMAQSDSDGKGGPLQGAGPLQGRGPQENDGPFQGNGPLRGGAPLQGNGPLQGDGPLQGTGPLDGSGPLQGAGPLQGDSPIIGGDPAGVGGPIVNFAGGDKPPAPPGVNLASLPPNLPLTPPGDPPPPPNNPGPPTSPTAGPPGGPPTPPGDPSPPAPGPGQPPSPTCVTCGFKPLPPPAPTPPPNNVITCANVTCN